MTLPSEMVNISNLQVKPMGVAAAQELSDCTIFYVEATYIGI